MWLSSLFKRKPDNQDSQKQACYLRFRALGRTFNLGLIKELPQPALQECAKKLGLIKAGTFILNQDDEIAVAYDYCLHHHRRVGRNIIERTLENAPPAVGSDERLYLDALLAARFSLYAVQEVLPHSAVRLMDLLSNTPVEILDRSLASTAVKDLIVAGRLLTVGDVSFSSGTLIPVPQVVYEIRIRPVIQKFLPDYPGPHESLSPARSAAFEAEVLRIALHAEEDVAFYTDMEV